MLPNCTKYITPHEIEGKISSDGQSYTVILKYRYVAQADDIFPQFHERLQKCTQYAST